ncbi:hypothetical protein AB6A40_006239 [Gnathostoma spinigerum]|uniref:Uncharacterized protein n=1 Tax=Gnathostoma spinigerum TaxID=75299 RepID=A0ABD6ETF1_9BILA
MKRIGVTNCITKSPKSPSIRSNGRRRAFSYPIRTSKFWLRILRPWKWKKRHHNSSVRRSSSENMVGPTKDPEQISSSFSTFEQLTLSHAEEEVETGLDFLQKPRKFPRRNCQPLFLLLSNQSNLIWGKSD